MFIIYAGEANAIPAKLGGKASALAVLSQQGVPIPPWFVISPDAFVHSLTDRQQQVLRHGEVHPAPTQEEVAAALAELHLNASVAAELTDALTRLCPGGETVAVRSSALDEDGTFHSFAGQLDSFLNVSPKEVAERVVDVWRSGFSDRLLTYRQEHHLSPLPPPPAVLIQRMVNAEAAGVAFSANPVTGQRRMAVVSAVRGLGTALVSGESDADTYHVDRRGQIQQRYLTSDSAGDSADTQQPILTDDQVQAIAALVRQVEQYFGRPQDMEWAIANQQLYLLQARPITALAQLPDPDSVLNLWDNSNIVESYSGVTTPLTFSFARYAYEQVYRQFCRIMGVPGEAIAQHDTTFRRMIGLLRGRIYYNLLNWYRVLALLPGFTVNRRFMEQMMGVREELPADVLTTLATAGLGDKLKDSVRLMRTLLGLLKNLFTLPHQIQRFYQRFNHALSLPQTELPRMDADELVDYYHDLERQLLTHWDAPLINDFFAMIFYGVLRKLTVAWCSDTDGTLQNDLISGEGGMISAEPAQRVRQMAQTAAAHGDLVEVLCHGSLMQIEPVLNTYPAFREQYVAYLDRFGDRCLEELKLESTTLHDDPLLLLRSVGQLAQQSSSLTATLPESGHPASLRSQAEIRVRQSLRGHPLRQLVFNWVLHHARSRVRDRENLRFERTRLFGRVRRIFLELGRRFVALDQLQNPSDIFYLNVDEILGFVDGTTTCTDLMGLVTIRRTEFDQYRHLPAPADRVTTHGVVHQGNQFKEPAIAFPDEGDAWQGIGCCPGVVRAPVQVITDPRHAVLRHGSILVAERTDPGWIMLFPAASGLLVERGSLLSHSAIVAREMGIPAIVSLPGVTHWLQDGDWVELDGSTGRVRRLDNDQTVANS